MKDSRLFTVFSYDISYNWKRPFYWIWFVVLAWNGWLMSTGNWIIRSIDTQVGTEKSFVNSEFQIAFVFALMPALLMGLFMAIATGTPLIRDVQYRVGEILNTTSLRPREYIWGKFFAAMGSSVAVLILFLLSLIFLNEVLPNPAAADIHGPFRMRNYGMPALVFFVPILFFIGGTCFALSEFTRKVFLVYLLPVLVMLASLMFFIAWFPPDMDPTTTRILQWIDPTGFRWLKQNWLIVDRGVAFYNTQSILYDAGFLFSRLVYVLFGLVMVWISSWNYERRHARIRDSKVIPKQTVIATPVAAREESFGAIRVTQRTPSLLKQIGTVLRMELREIASQTWLVVFIVMIAVFLVAPDRGGTGPLHIMNLYTSGSIAAFTLIPLVLMICFLILFTTTESLHRENQTGLGAITYTTPLSTFALLSGKAIANFAVALSAMGVSFLAAAGLLLLNAEGELSLGPFIQVWGFLGLPTIIFWCAFVMASFSLTRNRMSTYGIAIVLLFATGWASINNLLNWVTNWPLMGTLTWTDFGAFDIDRDAYWLNRLFYLSLSISLFAFAVKRFPRRYLDANHARPGRKLYGILRAAPFILVPLVLGLTLWVRLEQGFQGRATRNAEKDYWRKNMASFANEPLPHRTRIDIDLRLEPSQRSFHIRGRYELQNRQEKNLYRVPFTGVGKWSNVRWKMNGKEYKPEERVGMFVFSPDTPLQPQQTMNIEFEYDGVMLPGITRNGGEIPLGEFILPSGVALTGRNAWFVPVLGYVDSIGVDEKNRYEPKDPGPHFYEGITDAGIDRSLLDTHIRIDVPEEYFATSMGVLKSETVSGGRRILFWESDYPVRVFNVVAGKWVSKSGKASTVYYDPRHHYNIDTLLLGLDTSRQFYSQWFGPYVWKELRMNEFPAYAIYARGNPTNIFFSEAIGFLGKDATDAPAAFGLSPFGVTAHEAAHQWWGHMLSPGDGPGGIVLAEGMANYATMLLIQQVQGDNVRQMMSKQIEAIYGESRGVSSERPLSKSTFFRPEDTTVVYDKGGWVFWMMTNLLGRDSMFAGLTAFIQKWHKGPDHPVLEDFVADMRPYASDAQAYDQFVKQWIFEVAMPEYRYMEKPSKEKVGNQWRVKALIQNVGNASMPVDVVAASGRKFEKDGEYRELRMQMPLPPGQPSEVVLLCDFDPERIVVDPDIQVFQLQRNAATFRFKK